MSAPCSGSFLAASVSASSTNSTPTPDAARIPGWFLLGFVIALGLFARDSYRQVFRWLCPRGVPTPGRSTLAMARQRLGVEPLRRLAATVVRLLADPVRHPAAFWRGRRLLAVDGFRLDLPDTPANARHFGRPKGGRTPGAFPRSGSRHL